MMARFGHLNPYDLHKRLINEYVLKRAGDTSILTARDATRDKTDSDVIREHHKFLWDDDSAPDTWEQQLAKKYYDKLFTEYCICDLSRYRENKVALRWRIEAEVVSGNGQFVCGNKACTEREALRSWEVNFGYVEHGERKNALVKLRLCPDCSTKLNYRSKKREIKRIKKMSKSKHRKRHSTNPQQADESGSLEVEPASKAERVVRDNAADETSSPSAASPKEQNESTTGNWAKGNQNVEEKSREEEFDEYLEDLLL